MFVNKKLKIKN